jgi:hypothetical protein
LEFFFFLVNTHFVRFVHSLPSHPSHITDSASHFHPALPSILMNSALQTPHSRLSGCRHDSPPHPAPHRYRQYHTTSKQKQMYYIKLFIQVRPFNR